MLMMEQQQQQQQQEDRAFFSRQRMWCAFSNILKHCLRQIAGKLLIIIWDGSPIHRAKVLKELVADGAATRVQLEQLPAYVLQS